MAVCFDPDGAEFDIWEPRAMLGTDADSSLHGAPSWFQRMTTDAGRATSFYTSLLGWTADATPMPGFEYTTFKNGNVPVGGLMPISPGRPTPRSSWATYFTVDDPDEAARLATELGGQVHVPLEDIPGIGRFCGITSPQGVPFYAIRYAPRQEP